VLEKQLEEAFLGLNELLGLEKEERPNLKGEFLPDWLEDVNLERHLTRVLNGNPLLWLQEQKIRMAEYGLALYTYNVGAEPYKVKEIDVLKEKNNLAAMKEDLETTILSLYNQLQQLENQYALLEVNLAKAQKALDAVTVRYAQGMAVAIDVQQAELVVAQLEHQLRNILIAYEQMKILFQKPWLKPTTFEEPASAV
jgi:outer membrane protein TolC